MTAIKQGGALSDRRRQKPTTAAGRLSRVQGLAPLWQELLPELQRLEMERCRVWRSRRLALVAAFTLLVTAAAATLWCVAEHYPWTIVPTLFFAAITFAEITDRLLRPLRPLEASAGKLLLEALARHNRLSIADSRSFPAADFHRHHLLPPDYAPEAVWVGCLRGLPVTIAAGQGLRGLFLVTPRPPGQIEPRREAAEQPGDAVELARARGPFRHVRRLLGARRRASTARTFALTYWIMKPARGSARTLLSPELQSALLRVARLPLQVHRVVVDGHLLLLVMPGRPDFFAVSAFTPFDRIEVLAQALDDFDLLIGVVEALASAWPGHRDTPSRTSPPELTP